MQTAFRFVAIENRRTSMAVSPSADRSVEGADPVQFFLGEHGVAKIFPMPALLHDERVGPRPSLCFK